MKKNGTVLHELDGQKGELVTTVVQAVFQFFKLISERQLAWLLKHKSQVIGAILNALCALVEVASQPDHAELRKEQEKFYSEVLGMVVDLSELTIPTKPEGDWWLIVVAPGVTYNQIIAALRKLFPVWVYANDLDKVIDMAKEQRQVTDKPYAVWVKANVEADSNNANKSANNLVNTNQTTLKERLLLEGVYFKRTGRHLDVSNWTLCAGSRSLGGGIPHVYWHGDGGELGVDWCHPGRCDGRLRSRSVSS